MAHYVIAQIDIHDPDAWQAYAKVGGAAVAKHGGRLFAQSDTPIVLEDTGAGAPKAVILEFPDLAAAQNWIADPELAPVHAKRKSAAKTLIVALEGKD